MQVPNKSVSRHGLVTANKISVLQKLLKSAQGGQSGSLVTSGALNFASHGPASIPSSALARLLALGNMAIASELSTMHL